MPLTTFFLKRKLIRGDDMDNSLIQNKSNKISGKNWIIIWIAGLAGQLCWNIENQWFNDFVYDKIAPNPDIISWMVGLSAIATTFATFLFGTLSDRLGKRRIFISIGYVLWGVFTIIFGLTEFLPKSNIMTVAVMVVAADAVMSFAGSMGNDAGFNPWTTDITNERNRGGLGAVIAVQPVVATILGSVVFGYIIGAVDYIFFFVIMGAVMMLIGAYCFFTVKESPDLKPNRDPKGFWHQFGTAFNFNMLKKHKLLMLVFLVFSVFFISFNVYFPHILNYFIYTAGYDKGTAGLLMGIGLIIAVPATFLTARFLNRGRFGTVLTAAVIANVIGLIILAFTDLSSLTGMPKSVLYVVSIVFVGAGYMCVYQSLMIWVKNLYPEDKRAQFEGIRLLFYVCIPMLIGPAIASPIIKSFGNPMVNSYGEPGYSANAPLFFIAAGMAVLTLIPIYFAVLSSKKQNQLQDSGINNDRLPS